MPKISIADAAALLRRGELAAFPTETVYGLGANALQQDAVQKIYQRKGRPATSPLIVHASSLEMARTLVREWPDQAERLAQAFWPGPLTLVLPKHDLVPDIVTAGLPSVGLRVPNHAVALELIARAALPLAAPSANRFMQLSPTTAEHVLLALGDDLPVVDGGPCSVGIESTVVQIAGETVTLLRPGGVSRQQLEVVTQSPVGSAAALPGEAHPAPGMHARHYSPRTPLLLVSDPSQLPSGAGAYLYYDKSSYDKSYYDKHSGTFAERPGTRMPADPNAYAARLYGELHKLDAEGWAWIAVESPPDSPEWAAVLDRLRRAASR